jgi:uncharacterized membrane protein SpoIIM required for sporulation
MVLESLFNPLTAEKKPWDMFFIGALYSTIAIFLSLWVFKEQASLVMVFFTVMACIPIVFNTMKLEENKDMDIQKESTLLVEHGKALLFLILLFAGITFSFVLWYMFLPSDTLNYVFNMQTTTIQTINNQVSGNAYQNFLSFTQILSNNIRVLAFSVLFSFIYGAGAIFILTWNASVIGAAIGNTIRSNLGQYAGYIGLGNIANYFNIVALGVLRYALHGVWEILAYFVGALAGGIISVVVISQHYKHKNFHHIILDVSELLFIGLIILVWAAYVEVYITPILF